MNHIYEFIVQETDLDSFGHVNHANYLRLFEQARWDWMTSRGYDTVRVNETQIGPTILGLTIEYKRELRPRQRIRIESVCSEIRGKIFYINQKMLNERDEVCCEIKLTAGLFDMQKRKLIHPTPDWLNVLGSAMSSAQSSP